jgi:N-acetylglutamate synthase
VQTRVFAPDDPQWLRAQANLAGHDPATMATLESIVRSIACEARGVLVYHKAGLPVASAMVAVVGSIAVYVNVVTHPSARGMGYGRAVMSAALNAARSMGATHSAIQVLADNEPALNLYGSLGFGEVYSYSYRRAPDWSTR